MSETREGRREEIDAILDRKPGASEARDEADRYTVVGAASRETFANWLTPIEEHFVCHRNPMPDGDADAWTIDVAGTAGDEAELSLTDIVEDLPTVAVAHTMECAGNGRGQHDPETGSVQWDCEAVGTAVWTGTPVRSVLRAAGLDTGEAVGDADSGTANDPTNDEDRWLTAIGDDGTEEETFARSIPLSKALDDCLLAHGMNGEALPTEHGHPVRLVVPGWYGVNSVKWLSELRVMDGMVTEGSLDRPGTHARWQQDDYRIHPAGATPEHADTVPTADTWDQLEPSAVDHPYTFDETVMSLIGRPTGEEPVTPHEGGENDEDGVTVRGVAWAGDDEIAGVEISTNGGETWHDAELFGPDYAGAWRLFEYDWEPEPGTYTLASRATDERGRVQPASIGTPEDGLDAVESGQFPWNEGGYAANAYLPNAIEVEVTNEDDGAA
ncbi:MULTISPECIES: sulfite oxidase [Halococcus]|uniref:Oxidoreductase molybdopterin binding protein n=1 Tax=Halococcus salifodinae DSM 8989 TaxID=1227456 RepID=M0N6W3_9EURY|nr:MULTISPECIES: sulfite oxidase [Halococcus]EMA53298.1 oxidoreductase molybdopterin binding protein [Halococcus salifodinae DSM 8989]